MSKPESMDGIRSGCFTGSKHTEFRIAGQAKSSTSAEGLLIRKTYSLVSQWEILFSLADSGRQILPPFYACRFQTTANGRWPFGYQTSMGLKIKTAAITTYTMASAAGPHSLPVMDITIPRAKAAMAVPVRLPIPPTITTAKQRIRM